MLDVLVPALSNFSVARLPAIHFGRGEIDNTVDHLKPFGTRILIVTGGHSFVATDHWPQLKSRLADAKIDWEWLQVSGEPSPQLVDQAVKDYHGASIEAVLGIGGGSVLDAAKAIAGLLPSGRSVLDHLESVGRGLPYEGPATPFIAIPTTAGTGSEATKNAVLSELGVDGFKKSFRHEALVAQLAIVDPELLYSCPKSLLAANGMDAFTQLLESYVSIKASPFTDALAWSGMTAFRDGFWTAWEAEDPEKACTGYTKLALASLLSGMTLAQAGLGSVHGLASPLGAFFPIPHGVVCGTLLAEACAVNVAALRERDPAATALAKYAAVGRLITGDDSLDQVVACDALISTLQAWTDRVDIARLAHFGVQADDFDRIVKSARGGSMKTNPLTLTDDELRQILSARL